MDANSDLRCASSLLATITPDVNVAKNRLMYMSIVAINDWNMRCVLTVFLFLWEVFGLPVQSRSLKSFGFFQ